MTAVNVEIIRWVDDDQPGFVSLSDGGTASRYVRNGYLPGEHQGTPINIAEKDPEKMVRRSNPRDGDRLSNAVRRGGRV